MTFYLQKYPLDMKQFVDNTPYFSERIQHLLTLLQFLSIKLLPIWKSPLSISYNSGLVEFCQFYVITQFLVQLIVVTFVNLE